LPYIHNAFVKTSFLTAFFMALVFTLSAAPFEQAAAQGASLQGYQAQYSMKLLESKPASNIAALNGQLEYDFKEDCDGWSTSYQFDFKYNFTNHSSGQMTTQTTTYESKDFSRYNFSIARQMAGAALDSVKGRAELSDDVVKVYYMGDAAREETYKGDILLPSEHALILLEQARAGKAFSSYEVFDGLEQQGTRTITSYVFPYKEDGDYAKAQHMGVLNDGMKKWRVSVAYFSDSTTKEASDYEMSATLYDNGVMDDIRLDYHDHIIGQELTSLSMYDAPHCP
jgi:hypothetical protein